jgi:HSP20 family protein
MATLVRFREPLRDVAALHNEMSRLMNGLVENGGRSNQAWAPAVDVWETEGELVYAFDLPGVSRDDIGVELEDGAVTVTAERKPSTEVSEDRFYRIERRFGSFSRTISVPQGTTDESIGAEYDNGVLELRVRKPEQPKPRRIAVGGGSGPQTIDATA